MSRSTSPEPLAHALMFWLLASMCIAAAAPCFLVPPIDTYRQLRELEHRQLARIKHFEELLAHQTELLEALRSDPQVNIRLAQRELNYRQPGEIVFVSHVPVPSHADSIEQVPALGTEALPNWMTLAYPSHFAVVYQRDKPRKAVLAMSLGMILFAAMCFNDDRRKQAFISSQA